MCEIRVRCEQIELDVSGVCMGLCMSRGMCRKCDLCGKVQAQAGVRGSLTWHSLSRCTCLLNC